jgi:starch-binding outer membrane protein, SusD/RagB family
MKKIYFVLFVLVAAVSLQSCKKFLVADSPSLTDLEYVFNSEADAKKAVNAVYALFNQDAYTSRLSNNFSGNTDIECGGVSGSPDGARRDIWSFEATPANGDLLTVWNNGYNAINRANECEKGLTEVSLAKDPNNKVYNNLLGEAKTLRALWYYWLMNHWGDVPFKTTPSRAGDNFYLERTGRDTILTFLINDLIAVEPKMSWAEELDFGIERINREFVIGLIARLSLMRGGYWLYPDMTMKRKDDYIKYYEIANTYTKKLMDLKPRALPDYATVFTNVNKYIKTLNSDVLYEVAFHPGFGDVGWNHGIRVDAGTHPYGSGSNYLSLPITYYHSFDTTDKRLPVTCYLVYFDKDLVQQPSGATSIAPGKWNRLLVPTPLGPSTAKGTGINWPLMRYADILLMFAESENEINGPTAAAQEALRKVRKRAFPESLWTDKVETYISTVAGSKLSFFDAIVNERAWEFGGECLRKYDLARWNLYGKKVAESRNTLLQMGIDGNAGTGTYASLPDIIYYKRNSDNTISWYNKYRKATVIPPLKDVPSVGSNPDGYLQVNWTKTMYTPSTSTPGNFVLWTWRGYTDNTGLAPLRYILPLHSGVITSSLGTLKNQYGY